MQCLLHWSSSFVNLSSLVLPFVGIVFAVVETLLEACCEQENMRNNIVRPLVLSPARPCRTEFSRLAVSYSLTESVIQRPDKRQDEETMAMFATGELVLLLTIFWHDNDSVISFQSQIWTDDGQGYRQIIWLGVAGKGFGPGKVFKNGISAQKQFKLQQGINHSGSFRGE